MHNDFIFGIFAIPGGRALRAIFILEVEALPVKFVAMLGPGIFVRRRQGDWNFI
jgi:hypothetical protein